MTEEKKKGFGAWVQKKIGPEGRRISVLLNGEDFKIWSGLQQPGESHNATMHRVIREVSGQAGGDVLFEIKGMLARLTGEVSALRDEVRSLKCVSAGGSVMICPEAESGFRANDSADDVQTLAEIKARLTTKEPRKQLMADALLPLIGSWAANGVSQAEIAKRLKDAGIPTAHKGGTWNQSTVSGLLTRAKKAVSEQRKRCQSMNLKTMTTADLVPLSRACQEELIAG
ncbi:MAG: recombinase family protein [Deltaproteobacteria bacterium]|nr:recombinase family protein [Deltaproteobacteria bacterium]